MTSTSHFLIANSRKDHCQKELHNDGVVKIDMETTSRAKKNFSAHPAVPVEVMHTVTCTTPSRGLPCWTHIPECHQNNKREEQDLIAPLVLFSRSLTGPGVELRIYLRAIFVHRAVGHHTLRSGTDLIDCHSHNLGGGIFRNMEFSKVHLEKEFAAHSSGGGRRSRFGMIALGHAETNYVTIPDRG